MPKWYDLAGIPDEPPRATNFIGMEEVSDFIDVDQFADLEVDDDLCLKDLNVSEIEDNIQESLWNTNYEGDTEVTVIPRKSLKAILAEHAQYQNYVCAGAFQAQRLRKWEAQQKAKSVYREQLIAKGIIKPATVAVIASTANQTQTNDKENTKWLHNPQS